MFLQTLNLPARLFLGVAAGAALTAAFEPFNYWLVAYLAPAALFILWHRQPAKSAAWIGYAFGLGFFGSGVSWVYNSIHEFGHAPVFFAAFLTLLFVLTIALFPATCAVIQAVLLPATGSILIRYLAVIPAAWILMESVRGWLFTGFPWLQIGYSQLETPIAGIAPVAGVLGAGWVTVVIAAGLAAVVLSKGWQRLFLILPMLLLLFAGSLLSRFEWTEKSGAELSAALVQGNILQENKWQREWLLPTIDLYSKATMQHLDKDLVIWPEVALPGRYRLFKSDVLDPLQRRLLATDTTLVFGVLKQEQEALYNALIALNERTTIYKKRHLVPFGEFIPLRDSLTWLKDMIVLPAADISAGTDATLLPVSDYLAAGSICYEDAFGREVIDMLPQAHLLINVSNDAWFGDSLAPHQHLQIARMRALETGRPLLRATNTGISAVVDYRGNIVSQSPQFEMHILEARIQPRQGATPYVSYGDKPLILILLLLLIGAGVVPWLRHGNPAYSR